MGAGEDNTGSTPMFAIFLLSIFSLLLIPYTLYNCAAAEARTPRRALLPTTAASRLWRGVLCCACTRHGASRAVVLLLFLLLFSLSSFAAVIAAAWRAGSGTVHLTGAAWQQPLPCPPTPKPTPCPTFFLLSFPSVCQGLDQQFQFEVFIYLFISFHLLQVVETRMLLGVNRSLSSSEAFFFLSFLPQVVKTWTAKSSSKQEGVAGRLRRAVSLKLVAAWGLYLLLFWWVLAPLLPSFPRLSPSVCGCWAVSLKLVAVWGSTCCSAGVCWSPCCPPFYLLLLLGLFCWLLASLLPPFPPFYPSARVWRATLSLSGGAGGGLGAPRQQPVAGGVQR